MPDINVGARYSDGFEPWEEAKANPVIHIYRCPVTPQTFFRVDDALAARLGIAADEYIFVKFQFSQLKVKGKSETRTYEATYGPEWLYANNQKTAGELDLFFNYGAYTEIYAISKGDYTYKRENNSVINPLLKGLLVGFNLNVLLTDTNGNKSIYFYFDYIYKSIVLDGEQLLFNNVLQHKRRKLSAKTKYLINHSTTDGGVFEGDRVTPKSTSCGGKVP